MAYKQANQSRIIDNPLLCTVFNLSRLSLFPICHTQLFIANLQQFNLQYVKLNQLNWVSGPILHML
jgi:hypothetical protein